MIQYIVAVVEELTLSLLFLFSSTGSHRYNSRRILCV